ncbi:DUF2489 domain-containing protein [Vibrio mimicus]|uniref:DUF2489 domain-containing protein n=1 Tax=Vibrio mimicus TaxID=674 RepID=UPI00076AF95F|nr:DUF2489 domain-containing protein [Vibrio mimicus]
MNGMLLASVGGAIIVALASYAAYLLWQVKKQQTLQLQHQQLVIEKRNANIFDSVNILCMAGIQGQCDLSEISIRVYCIMDYVQGEQRVNFEQEYPAISELYHLVKGMARGDARQQLPKQERMKQNLERTKAESRLQDAIIEELTALKQRIQPLNNQIAIQMV